MGEQVAAAVGKNWLDGVFADLEGIGYACGAAVVPACAVDAPHRRDRLWFVAERDGAVGDGERARLEGLCGHDGAAGGRPQQDRPAAEAGSSSLLADADGITRGQGRAINGRRDQGSCAQPWAGPGGSDGSGSDVADADGYRCGARKRDDQAAGYLDTAAAAGVTSAWNGAAWIIGYDGKARRIEPGIRLLAHGVSGRVAVVRTDEQTGAEVSHWYNRIGALRAFGNAIVPQVAAEVIAAYMDCAP